MNVMIFAAGLGTRLKPFTDSHPKALAPVAGVPTLERNLRNIKNIRSASVDKVVINIHHFPEQIRSYVAENDCGLPVEFSDESNLLLDTGGGLLKAETLLSDNLTDDTLLLVNADILTDLPLDKILEAHRDADADVMLLCANRQSSRTLWFDRDNRLAGWENLSSGETKPEGFASDNVTMSQTPFCGVHLLKASTVLPLLKEYAKGMFGQSTNPFPIIPFYLSTLNELNIRRFLLPGDYHWFDIGSPSKLEAATNFFK